MCYPYWNWLELNIWLGENGIVCWNWAEIITNSRIFLIKIISKWLLGAWYETEFEGKCMSNRELLITLDSATPLVMVARVVFFTKRHLLFQNKPWFVCTLHQIPFIVRVMIHLLRTLEEWLHKPFVLPVKIYCIKNTIKLTNQEQI